MATLSTAERNAIMDAILTISADDYVVAGRALKLLQSSLSAIGWAAILRSRAAIWAPFLASGMSITWWCDETLRYAAL